MSCKLWSWFTHSRCWCRHLLLTPPTPLTPTLPPRITLPFVVCVSLVIYNVLEQLICCPNAFCARLSASTRRIRNNWMASWVIHIIRRVSCDFWCALQYIKYSRHIDTITSNWHIANWLFLEEFLHFINQILLPLKLSNNSSAYFTHIKNCRIS